jgi:hypothetical protein
MKFEFLIFFFIKAPFRQRGEPASEILKRGFDSEFLYLVLCNEGIDLQLGKIIGGKLFFSD